VGCRLGLARASAVAEWVQAALAGVAGAPVIGAVVIGAAETPVIGAVAIGMAATGAVAIGVVVVTGTAAIGVITSSSSATSAFRGGGAGAIRTDTTVAVTRTITTATAMATVTTATDMVVATDMITTSLVTGTAIAANQGLLSCSGDLPARAIIVAVLTGSWGPRRGEQFELTSAIMEM
jgi:hypothetical protein